MLIGKLLMTNQWQTTGQWRIAGAVLSMLVALVISLVQPLAYAKTDSAQHRLDLVKQALVDLSLGSDIKLATSAYIDSTGVLHESSVLKTNTQVRGIRVKEYLEDAGVPQAKVEASVLPGSGCEDSKPAVKHQASVRMVIKSDARANKRIGDHYLAELSFTLRQSLVTELSNSGHWLVAPEKHYASSYARLVSAGSGDNPRYRFDILLGNRDPLLGVTNHGEIALHHALKSGYDLLAWSLAKVPVLGYNKPWPEEALSYELVLHDLSTQQVVWRGALPLDYPKVARGYTKSPLPTHFVNEITDVTQQFVSNMIDSTSCQIGHFKFTPVAENPSFGEIEAGSVAGVSVGDQFLIVKDHELLNQALTPSGLDALALAEVISVTSHTAILKRVAGSDLFGPTGTDDRVAMLF